MRPRGIIGYFLFLKAVLALYAIRASLTCLGFARTLRIVGRIAPAPAAISGIAPEVQPGSVLASSVGSQAMVWAVRAAVRRTVHSNPCLPTALAGLLFLRRAGFPAELRIGVDRPDAGKLSAHAWVESNGVVVLGGAKSPTWYRAFPNIAVARSSTPEGSS